jgi:hypothetical protein
MKPEQVTHFRTADDKRLCRKNTVTRTGRHWAYNFLYDTKDKGQVTCKACIKKMKKLGWMEKGADQDG